MSRCNNCTHFSNNILTCDLHDRSYRISTSLCLHCIQHNFKLFNFKSEYILMIFSINKSPLSSPLYVSKHELFYNSLIKDYLASIPNVVHGIIREYMNHNLLYCVKTNDLFISSLCREFASYMGEISLSIFELAWFDAKNKGSRSRKQARRRGDYDQFSNVSNFINQYILEKYINNNKNFNYFNIEYEVYKENKQNE